MAQSSNRSELHAGSGQFSLAALAVLAVAPDSAMGANARAPAVLAEAPLAIMLADARAPAVLAGAPDAVMRAYAGAPAVFAPLLQWRSRSRSLSLSLSSMCRPFLARPWTCCARTCWRS